VCLQQAEVRGGCRDNGQGSPCIAGLSRPIATIFTARVSVRGYIILPCFDIFLTEPSLQRSDGLPSGRHYKSGY
jgi:hypothetical protein